MMPTALEEASLMKLPQPTPEQLLEADLNLKIGAHHFGRLLKIFKGDEVKALMAYNAGAGAVKKWSKTDQKLEEVMMVESVPLEEPREYVKRILTTWAIYRHLYEQKAQLPSRKK
jgi:soluble lytic murein transglycosylase